MFSSKPGVRLSVRCMQRLPCFNIFDPLSSGFIPPYALQRILTALADPAPGAKNTAYLFAVVAFLANLSFAQVDINKLWFTRRCYERTRGQLFCALHYK